MKVDEIYIEMKRGVFPPKVFLKWQPNTIKLKVVDHIGFSDTFQNLQNDYFVEVFAPDQELKKIFIGKLDYMMYSMNLNCYDKDSIFIKVFKNGPRESITESEFTKVFFKFILNFSSGIYDDISLKDFIYYE